MVNRTAVILTVFLWVVPVFAESFSNVLIVSIDALHPDALSAKTSPVIYRQMISGAYTLSGTSTDPPLTPDIPYRNVHGPWSRGKRKIG